MIQEVPNPLIQYLSHKFTPNPSVPDERAIIFKFAVNPGAFVDFVDLEIGGQRVPCEEWRHQLVSVSSPGSAPLKIPDWLSQSGQTAQIVVTIKGREWVSANFSWKRTQDWLRTAI